MAERQDTQFGVIHEIGDIGLGFDEVTPEENKQLNEAKEENKEEQ